jgi:ABC-type spermidine/putrescine transport system permease subunit II
MLRLLPLARPLIAAFVGVVLLYLVLPTFVVLPLSFSAQEYLSFPPQGFSIKWYQRLAANPTWLDATLNSVLIGIPAALLSMVLGTLSALAIVRGAFVRASWLSAALVAPMMLPHVILAIGLYPVMLELGLLRSPSPQFLHLSALPRVFITVAASLLLQRQSRALPDLGAISGKRSGK